MSEKPKPTPDIFNQKTIVKNGVYGVPLYQLAGTPYEEIAQEIISKSGNPIVPYLTLGQLRHLDEDPREVAGKYGGDFLTTEGFIQSHPNSEKVVERPGKIVPLYANPDTMSNGNCLLGNEYQRFTPQQMRSSFDVFDYREEIAERLNGRTSSCGGKGPSKM